MTSSTGSTLVEVRRILKRCRYFLVVEAKVEQQEVGLSALAQIVVRSHSTVLVLASQKEFVILPCQDRSNLKLREPSA